jgi:serine/threonine protein kinase
MSQQKKAHFFSRGSNLNGWTLIEMLGQGGNGEVWSCVNQNGDKAAIKILKKIKPKPYARFKDETLIIEQLSGIAGIVRIKDKFLPERLGKDVPFYIMPLAKNSRSFLSQLTIELKVDAIIQVAETVAKLHLLQIFHRDIKPANILHYDSEFALADFGLVDYPNKKEVSRTNEELGPKWTMAPEMRRLSSKASPGPADVYSLAKTLWIFLTGEHKSFDGQYLASSIISLKHYLPQIYTSPLDELLYKCTDNDPSQRLSIEHFINILRNWQKLERSFHLRKLEQWKELQLKIFPFSLPTRTVWHNQTDILQIVSLICSYPSINHFFFPHSGSLDLKSVKHSHEKECLEFDLGQIHIIKPGRLIFESLGYEHEWNYFRLEARELEISKVNKGADPKYFDEFGSEELTEISPGDYHSYGIYADPFAYKGDLDLQNMRRVRRWLRGTFAIFCRSSIYNLTPATNTGMHDSMSSDEFKFYLLRMSVGLHTDVNAEQKTESHSEQEH